MKYVRRLNLAALALIFTKVRLGCILLLALVVGGFALVSSHADTNAAHGPVGTKLWAYEASGTAGRILEYDIGTDVPVANCVPNPSGNGRGLAFDPADGNLWYTFITIVAGLTISGDGRIHKAAPPVAGPTLPCDSKGSIPFIDGLGGSYQDDVGAMDVDPDDGNIWAAGYQPELPGTGFTRGQDCNSTSGCRSYLYKVSRVDGSPFGPIQWCWIPFGGGGAGNDTLAVAKNVNGVPFPSLPNGTYLLTDAGEPSAPFNGDRLQIVNTASCNSGNLAPVAMTAPKPAMTGIDYEDIDPGGTSELIGSDLGGIYRLSGFPTGLGTSASMLATPSSLLEDITLETAVLLPQCSAVPNLVENPSFETVTGGVGLPFQSGAGHPLTAAQVDGWSAGPGLGTPAEDPDILMSTPANAPSAGDYVAGAALSYVPNNLMGQEPAKGGRNYAGISAGVFTGPGYLAEELIGTLTGPTTGTFTVSAWMSKGETRITDAVDMEILLQNGTGPQKSAAVEAVTITSGWQLVTGSVTGTFNKVIIRGRDDGDGHVGGFVYIDCVEVSAVSSVGGIVELRADGGDPSALAAENSDSPVPWIPLAAVAAGVIAMLGVGGWYGRRRWLR